MSTQTEAERLADALTTAVKQIDEDDQVVHVARWFAEDSAAELCRLDAVNKELTAKLAEHPAPVPGVVLREGQPTLVSDRDIKTTDVRLCVIKENQS